MSNIQPHPDDYNGLPYLATLTLPRGISHIVVVDFVLNGNVHYYHLSKLGVECASAFLTAVEEYHNGGAAKSVPLSIFITANHYEHVCAHGYQTISLDDVSIVGFCPTHWFQTTKVRWARRDLRTGQITKSKLRRPPEVIAAEKALKAERRAQRRNRPPKASPDIQVG